MTKRKKKALKVNFHDEEFLAKKLSVERRVFHREIKPIILADFPEILEKLKVTNPDIGLDKDDIIYLADPNHNIVLSTKSNISLYI